GLLSAFRATLEEISDSKLLVHLVDVSNPRWAQQIQSVEKILEELNISRIPSILALNKADIVDAEDVEVTLRSLRQGGEREVVTISAIKRASLQPLIESIGQMLSRDMGLTSDGDNQRANRLSRTA
ncbi:MAG TPA: hypothetical protein VEW46_04550, partial [Pyrinomonadaceae bacterium]|nr:hypothetical protein [Pyrinomonadaceae bacterium]